MRKEEKATLVLLLLTLTLITMPVVTNVVEAELPTGQGPREEDMSITFYATQEAAYTALLVGEIDLMLFDLTSDLADNAFTAPNIVTARVADSGFYEFDLNNNYTIADYPGIRSPMNYTEMRRAVAFLSDKDYYVGTLLSGKAVRIDQMVAAPYYSGWANEAMSYPYYPYEYNPAAAKALLDTTFPEGTTPNPDYDPLEPSSSQFLRTYPADHALAGADLDPLKFKVRVESSAQRESGRAVVNGMRKLGVPIDSQEGSSSDLYYVVMGVFNYHFYTGGWRVGTLPSMVLYDLYGSHSSCPYGSNYVTGRETHPHLDYLLNRTVYCSSEEVVEHVKTAVGYMTEICVNVPLWSSQSYWAWSSNLLGVVNMNGLGPENDYTLLNAYKVDGSPIRCGTVNIPISMNSVYSSWAYDHQVLDRMNLYGSPMVNPYNLAVDQPGFVTGWETTTWDDGGENKTLVHKAFRDDAYFCKPVSGDQGEQVNASHYFFNAWLDYQVGDGAWSNEYKDIHHIDITGPYDFEVYFNKLSYGNTYSAAGPLRPMDTWMAQSPDFINQTVETFVDPATPGTIPLSEDPIWIDYITADGAPLTMFTDYNIILGDIGIYDDLNIDSLEVSYWYVASSTALKGYTPGSQPWQTIFEGAGPYYCTAFDPGVGATFKRNPFYYMETPPLGEIDFLYHWSEGCYRVDQLDLDIWVQAFGTTGTGVPEANWFPGADLSPNGGIIDMLDSLPITGSNWGIEWGHGPIIAANIAVTAIVPSTEAATILDTVSINVTVENLGHYSETFDVEVFLSVYANTVSLAKQTVSSLAPNTDVTKVFEWNTTGYLTGPYKITALVNKLPNEADVNDNAFTYCMVTLTAPSMHSLKVTPYPALQTLLPFTANDTRIVAPWNGGLKEGTYTIEAPATVVDGNLTYRFQKWEDNATDPQRTIQLTDNLNITVYYDTSPQPLSTGAPCQLSTFLPTIYLSPSVINAMPFGSFTVNLSIANVDDLYSWQLKLYYDTRFLDAYANDVAEGPLLKSGGLTRFQKIVYDAHNATHGLIWMNSTFTRALSGVSGTGTLVQITLKTRAIGNSVAELSETSLCNSTRDPIAHETLTGLGLIRIRMKADINNDGVVNIFDLVMMAGSYGAELGQPEYSVHYDLIVNGAIDIFDLVYIALWYGKFEQGYKGPIERDPGPLPLDGPRRGAAATTK